MKLVNDQALDANGVKHLWKRILDLVHRSTPTKVSELENDRGYLSVGVTSFNGSTGDVNVTIPTKTSQLQNDSGFVTASESAGYTKSETDALLNNKQNVISDLSTIRSGAALGATALQSYTETDPTVPSWAKASSKPTYTAQEVGALPNTTVIPEGIPAGGTIGQVLKKTSNSDYAVEWDDEEGGGSSGEENVIEVVKVNGTALTPDVNKAVDVTVPTKVSDLNNDSGFTNNTGTITSVKMNGSTVASSGEANLGTVLTSHQDISGKADKVVVVDASTLPSTLDPNKVYHMGILTGSVTIPAFSAVASGDTEAKIWCFTFNTSTTAPTITWPAAITNWVGGSAPTINASKNYEVTVMDGIGAIMEA